MWITPNLEELLSNFHTYVWMLSAPMKTDWMLIFIMDRFLSSAKRT